MSIETSSTETSPAVEDKGPFPSGRVLIVSAGIPLAMDPRTLNQARALKRAGFDVSLLGLEDTTSADASLGLEGIPVMTYSEGTPFGLGPFLQQQAHIPALGPFFGLLQAALTKPGFEIVQFNSIRTISLPVKIAMRMLGKRVVVDLRTLEPEALQDEHGPLADAHYEQICHQEWFALSAANLVLCPSEGARATIIKRGSASEAMTTVVAPGSINPILMRQPRETRWLNGRRHLVVFAGEITARAGLDLLVRAARRIVYGLDSTEMQFAIVGRGPYTRALMDLVSAEGLKDFVSVIADTDPTITASVLSSASVAVDPLPISRLGEVLISTTMLDYQRLGLPIVAFDRAGARAVASERTYFVAENNIAALTRAILDAIEEIERPMISGDIANRSAGKAVAPMMEDYVTAMSRFITLGRNETAPVEAPAG